MRRTCRAAVAFGVCGLIGLFLFSATGCGSGSGSTQIRVLNSVPIQSNIDILIDGKSLATGVAYGTASTYASVGSGSRHLQLEPSGSGNPFTDQTIKLASGSKTTVAATAAAPDNALVVTDNNTAPSSGNVSVRVINASSNLGVVDIYIVTAGTGLAGQSPIQANVAAGSATGYTTLAAGNYQVIFTTPSTNTARLSTSSLSITSGQVRTVVAIDGQTGGVTATVLSDLN